MKKFAYGVVIFFLVLSTAIIKNTTKKIEDEIFTTKENIRILKSEFENVSLEYDYLSSAEKLLEYQSLYFEHQLIDYDPCSNYGNWNYIAGVGNDPRAGRKFNVAGQAERYDAQGEYTLLWENRIR